MANAPDSKVLEDGAGSPMVKDVENSWDYERNRHGSILTHIPTISTQPVELPDSEPKETTAGTLIEDHPKESKSTYCGLSRKRFWICVLAALSIAAIIAIIVGCVVGLRGNGSRHTGAPNYASTTGVFNGSGVVALDNGDGSSKIIMYSQYHNGDIRRSEYLDGKWSGGQSTDAVEVVGRKARNGSALMAVSFEQGDELIVSFDLKTNSNDPQPNLVKWRVFYIDVDGYLQESINSNKTQGGWFTGPLGQGRFKVSDSPHVGLSACHNPQWYGAPYNSSAGGLRLYYGAGNHTVQELRWIDGRTAWEMGANFPDSDGDGGVECTVAHSAPPSITNLWLLNTKGELEQRWFDFNESAATNGHKVGVWSKALTYPGPRPQSHITAITASKDQKLVHFQLANNTVRELIVEGTAESTIVRSYLDIKEKPALPGSHLGSVVLNTTLGGQEIHVYYQTNGSDISEFVRTLDGLSWAEDVVPLTKRLVHRFAHRARRNLELARAYL
ncbi:MAG: hypothetical protein M1835_000074 [Candelina submexicana]|nr:MAG: hypothetical protein M1835_000074 [Candelina submexicana]